jgi:hypothetical protein
MKTCTDCILGFELISGSEIWNVVTECRGGGNDVV